MSNQPPPVPYLYTMDEVALRLRVTRRTLQTYIAKGKIRAIKLSGAIRIPASELDRILGGVPRSY